jgi:creatinine deaminase
MKKRVGSGSDVSPSMVDFKNDRRFLRVAYEQALKSYGEGGLPIGAAMVENDSVVAVGHNRRVQDGDPIAHGEMDCFRRAGRRARYDQVTLYTTLSPCMMCSGTMVQFGIERVVVGEANNFAGNIEFLREHEVEVVLMDDAECIELMGRFIRERPDVWDEDIAGRNRV